MPIYGTGQAVGGSFEATDTISSLVGEMRFGNTGLFRYGKAGAALAAGDLCSFTTDGQYTAAKQGTAGAFPAALGVPQGDMASGTYGWFFIGCGTFQGKVAASTVANTPLMTTSGAAGLLDKAGGTLIGAHNVGATAGVAAVVTCFAPGLLGVKLYA